MKTNDQYTRINENVFHRIDWTLIILLLALAIISVVSINSAMIGEQHSIDFGNRQIIFYSLGFFMLLTMTFIPVKFFEKYAWVIFGISMLSLFILYVFPVSSFAPVINGAQRWFQLGFMSIQPSEFGKLAYIIVLAYIISQHNKYKQNNTFNYDIQLVCKLLLVSVLPLFFVLSQNDTGTMIVFIAILLGMILVSGINWWVIMPAVGLAVSTGIILLAGIIYRPDILQTYIGIQPYQLERIYSWLFPETVATDSGFQITNSLRAIGSGGVDGKGLGEGVVYIPENHTDFIFTIIGEEFGFLGGTVVILVFFILIVHLIVIALNVTDAFSSYFIIGYLCMLGFQIFQNIGMTIQLLPITGLPLPFLSYGGSALWAKMLGMGVIMNIYYHHYRRKT